MIVAPIFAVSPANMVTGSDSPVSAAWSISRHCIPAPSSFESAGTMSPSLSFTRSPGTRLPVSNSVSHVPSRLTQHLGLILFLSAAMASPAFFSSMYDTQPLSSCSTSSTKKSTQSFWMASTIMAIQIIMGIGPQNFFRKAMSSDSLFSCSALGPNSVSRRSASALSRPLGYLRQSSSRSTRHCCCCCCSASRTSTLVCVGSFFDAHDAGPGQGTGRGGGRLE